MTISYSCSFVFAFAASRFFPDIMIQQVGFPVLFGYAFSLGNVAIGPAFALFVKELSRSGEYYFYYNRSISKIKLIIIYMVLNILLSTLIYITLNVASS